MLIDMTYDEAVAIVESFTAGIENPYSDWQPYAPHDSDRLDAIRRASAFATVWREDVEKPGFEFPPIGLVTAVEYLIEEPVWAKRYYDDEGRPIES